MAPSSQNDSMYISVSGKAPTLDYVKKTNK